MKHTVMHLIRRAAENIWSLFLSGLFTMLPITLTVLLLNGAFKVFVKWLAPIQKIAQMSILRSIPHAEILITLLAIVALGVIMRVFILRSLVHGIEKLIFKIPLIRQIYSGIKQLIHAFSIHDKITFKQVVFAEFPRKGIYSLGFVTSELPTELSPMPNVKYYNVFIPTTPNPTSGFFIIIAQNELTITSLTRQEAMAMIISGGIIQPDRFADQ